MLCVRNLKAGETVSLGTSQHQFPCLPHEIMPETVMCFLGYEFETGFLVDVTRFQEHTVGPEHQFLVTTASSEANTLFDKASTQPKTTCLWFNQQQPELGDCFTALHDKYRTNDLSVHLC